MRDLQETAEGGREGGRLNIIRRDRDGWRKSNPWHCARARSRGEKESLFYSVGIASERESDCHAMCLSVLRHTRRRAAPTKGLLTGK